MTTGAIAEEGPSAGVRVAVSGVLGAIAAAIVAAIGPLYLIPLAGWMVWSLIFTGWIWISISPLSPQQAAERASRDNPGRAAADLLLLTGSVVSLLAVGLVLVKANQHHGLTKGLLVGACLASIVLSWATVHTIFTLRYADLYYDEGPAGGIDYHEHDAPDYFDFAYLALTIGMTFQVSDTDIGTKPIRRTALRHALLSYAFGALIIATTINLIAGLGK
ncbi:MAG: DUF1345 domain-containing protein [Solirubrobacteraceae bacterium]